MDEDGEAGDIQAAAVAVFVRGRRRREKTIRFPLLGLLNLKPVSRISRQGPLAVASQNRFAGEARAHGAPTAAGGSRQHHSRTRVAAARGRAARDSGRARRRRRRAARRGQGAPPPRARPAALWSAAGGRAAGQAAPQQTAASSVRRAADLLSTIMAASECKAATMSQLVAIYIGADDGCFQVQGCNNVSIGYCLVLA
uniref:Uncharacterized protein n=1 Tax=Leersia perrieri TaxID=77586 RepID=A0A0D9WY95_9ORYZ